MLLAWFMLAFVHPLSHIHDADGDDDGDHCAACVTLHAVASAPPPPPPPIVAPAPEAVVCTTCRPAPVANPLPLSPRAPPSDRV
jgi:hypothetical protein